MKPSAKDHCSDGKQDKNECLSPAHRRVWQVKRRRNKDRQHTDKCDYGGDDFDPAMHRNATNYMPEDAVDGKRKLRFSLEKTALSPKVQPFRFTTTFPTLLFEPRRR